MSLGARRARVRLRRRGRCRLVVAARDPRFGFNDSSILARRASPEQTAAAAEGTGAGIYRLTFDWRHAEPARDVYRWENYDRVYRVMRERGIKPLLILMWAPRWAWDNFTMCSYDCRLPPRRKELGEWREIAALLATRYPGAAGIEIWNEPNEVTFWQPRPDAARYAELLAEAHRAIKHVNAKMPVISGGIAHRVLSQNGSVASMEYARQVLQNGGGRHMDALGIHPYAPTGEIDTLRWIVDGMRSVRDRAGAGRIPLWVTEIGLTTTGSRTGQLYADEARQAEGLAATYRELRSAPDIGRVIFHTLIDPLDDPANPEAGFGIVRGDLSRKPAYCALRREVGIRGRCP